MRRNTQEKTHEEGRRGGGTRRWGLGGVGGEATTHLM